MTPFLVVLPFAFCLLPLPTLARPIMLVANQNSSSLIQIDTNFVFNITFSMGGPNIFTLLPRPTHSSSKLYSSRCSAALSASRPEGPSSSLMRFSSVGCPSSSCVHTHMESLGAGMCSTSIAFTQRLSNFRFSSLIERPAHTPRRGGPSSPVAGAPRGRVQSGGPGRFGGARGGGGPPAFSPST